MARWIGIDHGAKRIGLAVGSDGDAIASPLPAISATPEDAAINAILAAANEYSAAGLVVGLPLNMDDTEGPQAKSARDFAARLAKRTGMDVRLWDERLSSFAADDAMAGMLTSGKKKQWRDSLAAASILREFFSGNGPASSARPEF